MLVSKRDNPRRRERTGLNQLDDPVDVIQKLFPPHVDLGGNLADLLLHAGVPIGFLLLLNHLAGQAVVGGVQLDPEQGQDVVVAVQQLGRLLKNVLHGIDGSTHYRIVQLGQEVLIELVDGVPSRGMWTEIATPLRSGIQRVFGQNDAVLALQAAGGTRVSLVFCRIRAPQALAIEIPSGFELGPSHCGRFERRYVIAW